MSDESRADRLRRRRRAQRDQQADSDDPDGSSESAEPPTSDVASAPSNATELAETAETGETSKPSKSSKPSEPESVKDTRVGTYMYLPESQRTELDFRYKELNLAYERAFGDELEKNRHFYPLVVEAGLNALDGVDGEEVRELLLQLE
ncbi:hypothetical protein [Haladaptatus sp. DFWS20]|uniref:hypothetical protein n=1 Tax=Haladaptatus sp. DFWS20 TaxID=3403467 RepID=UPI003EBE831B